METPLLFECSYLFHALSLSFRKRINWCWCYLVTMRCCYCAGSGDGSLRAWSTQSGAEVSFIFPIYCAQVLEVGSGGWNWSLEQSRLHYAESWRWNFKISIIDDWLYTIMFWLPQYKLAPWVFNKGVSPKVSMLGSNNSSGWYLQIACWTNNAGVPACIKWAPRRLMFASASMALLLWIPDLAKLQNPESGP